MKNGFTGDLDKQFEQFAKLSSQEMTNAFVRGLRKAGKEVVNLTKASAVSGMKRRNNVHWYDGKQVFYNDAIEDAPRVKTVWSGWSGGGKADEIYVNVSIFGSTASDSGTYRFRFLEKGTKQRFAKYYRTKTGERKLLKKPRNLGSITPRWWFRNAYQAVQANVDNFLLAEIEKATNKLNAG